TAGPGCAARAPDPPVSTTAPSRRTARLADNRRRRPGARREAGTAVVVEEVELGRVDREPDRRADGSSALRLDARGPGRPVVDEHRTVLVVGRGADVLRLEARRVDREHHVRLGAELLEDVDRRL